MQQLLGDSAGPQPDNFLLRELFFQRLPSHVRMVLASSGDTVSLDTLADMADKMLEVTPPTVSSLTSPATPPTPPPPPPASSEVAQLRSEQRATPTHLLAAALHRSPRSLTLPFQLPFPCILPWSILWPLLVPPTLLSQGQQMHLPLLLAGKWQA